MKITLKEMDIKTNNGNFLTVCLSFATEENRPFSIKLQVSGNNEKVMLVLNNGTYYEYANLSMIGSDFKKLIPYLQIIGAMFDYIKKLQFIAYQNTENQ